MKLINDKKNIIIGLYDLNSILLIKIWFIHVHVTYFKMIIKSRETTLASFISLELCKKNSFPIDK